MVNLLDHTNISSNDTDSLIEAKALLEYCGCEGCFSWELIPAKLSHFYTLPNMSNTVSEAIGSCPFRIISLTVHNTQTTLWQCIKRASSFLFEKVN